MFCSSCGAEANDTASFCPQCGKPLAHGETSSSQGGSTPYQGQPVRARPEKYQGQPVGARPENVPNYLVQAILVTLFCCLPMGIVAIVFAAQVNGKLQAGDHEGALQASSTAKLWCWISFGSGLVLAGIYLLFFGGMFLLA